MSKFYKAAQNHAIAVPDDVDVTISLNGEELQPLSANTSDGAGEKHVPVVTVDGNKVTINVGEVPHPMIPEHYITEIFLETNKGIHETRLQPGQEPQAVFVLTEDEVPQTAYEYCNLHGLWKKDI